MYAVKCLGDRAAVCRRRALTPHHVRRQVQARERTSSNEDCATRGHERARASRKRRASPNVGTERGVAQQPSGEGPRRGRRPGRGARRRARFHAPVGGNRRFPAVTAGRLAEPHFTLPGEGGKIDGRHHRSRSASCALTPPARSDRCRACRPLCARGRALSRRSLSRSPITERGPPTPIMDRR